MGGQQMRVDTHAVHDLGGVAGEDIGVVPGVIAHDHAGRSLVDMVLQQVRAKARGGLRHDDPVHALGSGAQRPAQSGRAELQAAREALLEGGGLAAVDQSLQLRPGDRVGVLGDPVLCSGDEVHGSA